MTSADRSSLLLLVLSLVAPAAACGASQTAPEKSGAEQPADSRTAWDATARDGARGHDAVRDAAGNAAGDAVRDAGERSALPAMEPFSDESHGFALFKPKGWEVETRPSPDGYAVTVKAPSGYARVGMSFLVTADRGNDSVRFAAQALQSARTRFPDLKLSWSRTTEDRRRTVIEAQYTDAEHVPVKGRYYFFVDFPQARFFSCEAPVDRFDRMQPLLLSILSNVSMLHPAVRQAARTSPAPAPLPTEPYRLPDGSASLLAPPGWSLTGAKGACLCVSPDRAAGFAFTTAEFWAPSTMPYFDNSRLPGLHYRYMRPIDALVVVMQQLGSSNIEVEHRATNPGLAQEAAQRSRRRSDAESAVLTYTSGEGVPSRAYFEAIGSEPLPSGQWGILFYGIWAPDARFDAYRPTLEDTAASYRINEQWAADYIQRGLANLRRLMGETNRRMAETAEAARQSNLAVFQEKMRSGDYIDYKRTSTIRGEQEWISQAEGGTLYKSDHWGLSREGEQLAEGQPFNYYNFNGESPRFNETLIPVDVSREVYEQVYKPGW